MHTECEGKFSFVVKIVFDDVPDNPLARDYATSTREGLLKVGRSPVREGILDHLPGDLKCIDEFSGGVWKGAIVVPGNHWFEVCAALAHHKMESPDTGGNNVSGDYAY